MKPRDDAATTASIAVGRAAKANPEIDGLAVPEARPFTSLATVYDDIMAEVEYEEWCEFILREARARGYADGPVHDLGCGTGNATMPMFRRGLEVSGSDASEAMLAVARTKLPTVEFTNARFAELDLGRRFELVYSVFDALNNLLTDEDFSAAAGNVRRHLLPGGIFVFDVNTDSGLRELWEGGKAEGWGDDVYYRWSHHYDEETGLAHVEAFCTTETGSFIERHSERGYDALDLLRLLGSVGFSAIEVIDFPDGDTAPNDAARVWVVAKRD